MIKELGDLQQQCLTPPENAAIISALLDVEAKEKKIASQVILLQIVVTLFGASIAYSIKGTPQFAIAVLSGGGISVVNGALLAWRMVRAALHPAHEAHHQLRLMYFYAAERFLVVVALLCICIAVLKLSPLASLGGFVMGQAVFLAGRFILSNSKT
ncbi:MAG TPA: ATP synthase subunit I [Gallionella sp.]|nr:ATP synthase subunit I [Gallionella sp.]